MLETSASRGLLPLEHVSTITQGSRRTRREAVFDAENRRVQTKTGDAEPIALPMSPSARDPITALFYLRTLPLAQGARLSIPLIVNGTPSTLDLDVGAIEPLRTEGRTWPAWRVNVRTRQRVERRRPLSITAWISTEEHRVPIRFDVDAEFGTVRADLTEYRESGK
jgi:hypothetical protein